jgi:vancomycin permeability regulator SanA
MNIYDAIIVLSNLMDGESNLNLESKNRANLAFEIWNQQNCIPKLITMGWAYRNDTNVPISKSMANYLVNKLNVPKEQILSDVLSRDTVGDAFFSRYNFEKFFLKKKIIIITSDYHEKRAHSIFKFIYGENYKIHFSVIETDLKKSKQKDETDSLDQFSNTFNGIKSGDMNKIQNILLHNHPLYNGTINPQMTIKEFENHV